MPPRCWCPLARCCRGSRICPACPNTEQRFLRGGAVSGQIGGIDYFGTTVVDNAGVGVPQTVVTPDASPGAMPFPPYLSAVFVMRVK